MAGAMQFGFGTPFAAQLAFFKAKLKLPSQRWDDIIKSAHDKAFIVAGVAKADLLQELYSSIEQSIVTGSGLQQFRKDFDRIVQGHGWSGFTGEGSKRGIAWRTKVIYQTNMATSYAAGRYTQLHDPDLIKTRPYLRYVHADGVLTPRPLHVSWDGFTAPRNHPFWQTHFSPNGWGCHCRIIAVAKMNTKQLPSNWASINPATGAPMGVDRGFDYAPGREQSKSLRSFIANKRINLDGDIGRAMLREILPYLDMPIAAQKETIASWVSHQSRIELESKLKDVTVQSLVPMTVYEKAALREYSARSDDINQHLLGTRVAAKLNNAAGLISQALAKLPDYQGLVISRQTIPAHVLAEHKVDAVVAFPLFLSATTRSAIATASKDVFNQKPIRYIIKSKFGKQIDALSGIPEEAEVLFDFGSKFKVLSRKNYINGFDGSTESYTEIVMEQLL